MTAQCASQSPLYRFRITGWVGDTEVEAVYEDGGLTTHPALAARVEVAARVDKAFKDSVPSDEVIRSLLGLARALDRLISAEFELRSMGPPGPAVRTGA